MTLANSNSTMHTLLQLPSIDMWDDAFFASMAHTPSPTHTHTLTHAQTLSSAKLCFASARENTPSLPATPAHQLEGERERERDRGGTGEGGGGRGWGGGGGVGAVQVAWDDAFFADMLADEEMNDTATARDDTHVHTHTHTLTSPRAAETLSTSFYTPTKTSLYTPAKMTVHARNGQEAGGRIVESMAGGCVMSVMKIQKGSLGVQIQDVGAGGGTRVQVRGVMSGGLVWRQGDVKSV